MPDTLALPVAKPVRRPTAWAWPLLIALVFVAGVAGWLQWSQKNELDEERRTLLADTLTLESRLSDWVVTERNTLAQLAATLPAQVDDAALTRNPVVVQGLQRVWVSLTVLDKNNRQLAQIPQQTASGEGAATLNSIDDGGQSAHLVALRPGGGRLVARITPTVLLRQAVPWWLARKYDVRLVDSLGLRIAGAADALPVQDRQTYRVSMFPALDDTYVEVTTRELHVPWWRTWASALMGGFLLLTAAATWTLRRQMLEVARAEEASRTEAAWRRAIEDSLTVGLRGRDMQGRLVHVNRAFCDLVGFSAEELLGQVPPMPYWPDNEMAESMQRHLRNMAGQAPREGYESRWVRSDGRSIHVMIFEAPLVDAQGQQIGWMGSIVDLTAHHQMQERERRQLEGLAHQARLTTLGEVASALAHQLNQPLTAIASYNAGVLRSLERSGQAQPAVLEAVRRLAEQAAEAGRIVQRIRAFLTRRGPQREACKVDDLVERVMALLRRDLREQGVALEVHSPAAVPPVWADPVLVEQVLINLVRNAADAMRVAAVHAPCISVQWTMVGTQFVRVDVDDNGPGLQGKTFEQLSAPFYSTKADGMGMGLAICRSVIEAHHGGFEASTSPRGGARFSFTLAVVQEDVCMTSPP